MSNKQTAPFIRQKLFFILSIKNIVHNKRGYRTIDFPPRSAKLIFHPSQCHHFLHTHLIKQRDHTSHTKNRNHRSDSHADQFVSKHEAHRNRDTDIAQIKAVFPQEKWEVFLDNCAVMIYLGSGPAAFSTHEYISKLLGGNDH